MKPEIKQKWVDALRSRKYKPTTGALCRVLPSGSRYFCALGVLADIFIKETRRGKWKPHSPFAVQFLVVDEDYSGREDMQLSTPVLNWAGDPNDGFLRAIAEENDNGTPFSVLADIIECGTLNGTSL